MLNINTSPTPCTLNHSIPLHPTRRRNRRRPQKLPSSRIPRGWDGEWWYNGDMMASSGTLTKRKGVYYGIETGCLNGIYWEYHQQYGDIVGFIWMNWWYNGDKYVCIYINTFWDGIEWWWIVGIIRNWLQVSAIFSFVNQWNSASGIKNGDVMRYYIYIYIT